MNLINRLLGIFLRPNVAENPNEVHRLNTGEMNELALAIVQERVYIAVTDQATRFSFGHLFAMMDHPGDEYVESIGAVYEEYSKASPRALNGYPMFFSMKLVHRDDVQPLLERVWAKKEAMEAA